MEKHEPIDNISYLVNKFSESLDKIIKRNGYYQCDKIYDTSIFSIGKQLGLISILEDLVYELNRQHDILPGYFLKLLVSPRYTYRYNNKMSK